MSAYFITATGTDVGKTFVARGLIRVLRARRRDVTALKPVMSGFEPAEAAGSDGGLLLTALGQEPTLEAIAAISPWRFQAPLAPDMAAEREGRTLDYPGLIGFCQKAMAANRDALLIEGVGGLMSPIDSEHTVLDWMKAVRLPLIVVTGTYLGTLSHTLTALDVLARHGLAIAALVISESVGRRPERLDETHTTISRFAPDTQIVALPRLPAASLEQAAFDQIADCVR
ncbi:MAG TPA: dethiobiotin synthase [Xanthobacteraceae bacterium]|jgi:dethiobiotin synthetase